MDGICRVRAHARVCWEREWKEPGAERLHLEVHQDLLLTWVVCADALKVQSGHTTPHRRVYLAAPMRFSEHVCAVVILGALCQWEVPRARRAATKAFLQAPRACQSLVTTRRQAYDLVVVARACAVFAPSTCCVDAAVRLAHLQVALARSWPFAGVFLMQQPDLVLEHRDALCGANTLLWLAAGAMRR